MKDVQNMTDSEIEMVMRELAALTSHNAIKDFCEQHDLPEEYLRKYKIKTWVEDIRKVRLTSSKTEFVKIFCSKVRKILVDNKLDFKLLGFVTYLATCVKYEDNSLRNKDGSHMNKADIIEATKLSESTVGRYLNELIKQEIIFKEQHPKDKRNKKYYINPRIFYKGVMINSEIKDSLYDLDDN